jgi:glucokinase
LTREQNPALSTYLAFHASPPNTEMLTMATEAGTVVVPPEVKASAVVREVVSSAIGRIEADRILEERVIVDAVDLFYRPVMPSATATRARRR